MMKKVISTFLSVFIFGICSAQVTDNNMLTSDTLITEKITFSDFEDFGGNLYSGDLLFVSSMETKLFSKKYDYNNQRFFQLFYLDIKTKEIKPFESSQIVAKDQNYHFGPSVLKADSSGIFISSNHRTPNSKGAINFKISFHSFEGDTSYILPFCEENYNYQHPTYDDDRDVLYFSSDRAGSAGGYDVYSSKYLGNDNWSKPASLRALNTEKNELFPTVTDEGLYYSSPSEKGDLDIKFLSFEGDSAISSMDAFNSIEDDFHFIELAKDSMVFSRGSNTKFNSDLILAYYLDRGEPVPSKKYFSGIIHIDTLKDIAFQRDSILLLFGLEFNAYVRNDNEVGFPIKLNSQDQILKNLEESIQFTVIESQDSLDWELFPIVREKSEEIVLTRNIGEGNFHSILYKDVDIVHALQVLNKALLIQPSSFLFSDSDTFVVSGPKRRSMLEASIDSMMFTNAGLESATRKSLEVTKPLDRIIKIDCKDAVSNQDLPFRIDYYDYETNELLYSENIKEGEILLLSYLDGRVLGATITSPEYLPASLKIEQNSQDDNEVQERVVLLTKIKKGVEQSFTLKNIHFDFDDYTLTETAIQELDIVMPLLKQFELIKIVGHTDSKGSAIYNQRLSQNRSNSTKDYLSKNGIEPSLITPIGKGEEEPIDTNETEEGRANNRRCEFIVK